MVTVTLSMAVSALALFASSADAMPWPGKRDVSYTPARNLSKLALLMPKSDLAAPEGILKYVALGLGTQNYTCTTGKESDAPGTTGAVATLYDIGSKLKDDPNAQWKIPTISSLALSLSTKPDELERNLRSQGYHHVIGHHFFNKVERLAYNNTPIFNFDQLYQSGYPMAQVTKQASIDAPKSACPGLTGEGAVQWLFLKDKVGISHGGIDTVYRIETAGGKPPVTCKGQKPSFEVKYAAQYWVYGPA